MAQSRHGRFHSWYVLAVLFAANALAFADRSILILMVAPIRAAFHISDFGVSLLHGAAFGILYAILGVPIACLADRYSRTRLIAAAVFLWSAMTLFGGLARNVTQIFIGRFGVAMGEAGLSPAAYSLVADMFSSRRLPRALSLYTAAPCLGMGLAFIVTGKLLAVSLPHDLPVLGDLAPWQMVFLCMSAPGFMVAVLVLMLKEPTRRGQLPNPTRDNKIPVRHAMRLLYERRAAYGLLAIGYSGLSLVWNGVSSWVPTFLMRTYHAAPSETGWWLGILMIVFGSVGPVCGAFITERLQARGRVDATILVGILAAVLSGACVILTTLMPNKLWAMAFYSLFVLAASMPFGAAAAAIQVITPNQMRALVSALYFLVMNLTGVGLGPVVVALFTDFLFHDDQDLRYSLMITAGMFAFAAAVAFSCARRPYRHCIPDGDAVLSPGAMVGQTTMAAPRMA